MHKNDVDAPDLLRQMPASFAVMSFGSEPPPLPWPGRFEPPEGGAERQLKASNGGMTSIEWLSRASAFSTDILRMGGTGSTLGSYTAVKTHLHDEKCGGIKEG